MVPAQWWILMRPTGPLGRIPRAIDCNGLVNRVWPTTSTDHDQQKPYVVHGWPEPRGADLVWSWTWLDDDTDPPVDPTGLVGDRWRIGDDTVEVIGVTAGPRTTWADLLHPAWARPGGTRYVVTACSPVVQAVSAGTGDRRTRRYVTAVEPQRFFGRLPAAGRSVTTRGREHGLFSVTARFAPPELARQVLAAGRLVVPALQISTGPDWRVVSTYQPHQNEGVGRAWIGGVSVSLPGDGPRLSEPLAALINLAQVTGIGTGVAYGYGSITARPDLTPAEAARPSSRPRTATRETGSPPLDLLFDEV